MTSIKFIRPAELAEMISVSKSTLWRMEKEGELPPRRKISKRCVGWIESDIIQWLQATQSSTETPDYTQSTSHSQNDEPDRENFWEEEHGTPELTTCLQNLKKGCRPYLIAQAERYDLITKTTLEDYHCGVTEFDGENYIQIPYHTGGQLYRRDANNVKQIRQIPGSKPKESIFGEEQVLGSDTLHFCKSPREAMLLSQHIEDDCIGICAGENADLSVSKFIHQAK